MNNNKKKNNNNTNNEYMPTVGRGASLWQISMQFPLILFQPIGGTIRAPRHHAAPRLGNLESSLHYMKLQISMQFPLVLF